MTRLPEYYGNPAVYDGVKKQLELAEAIAPFLEKHGVVPLEEGYSDELQGIFLGKCSPRLTPSWRRLCNEYYPRLMVMLSVTNDVRTRGREVVITEDARSRARTLVMWLFSHAERILSGIIVELWDRVHEYLGDGATREKTDRTSHEENISPLKGLLKCGHCGGPLMHYTKRKKGAVYSYYRCLRDSKRAESVCPIKENAAPVVEKLVCERLSAIFRSPQVLAALSERTGVECAALLPAFDGDFWQEATSAERRRMIELLVAEAVLYGDRLELELQCEGIKSIMEEIENESSQN